MASSDTCFNSLVHDLKVLMNGPLGIHLEDSCNILSNKIRSLRTFHLLARKWGNDYDDAIGSLGALLVEIEAAVSKIAQVIHSFCVSLDDVFPVKVLRFIRGCIYDVSFKEEIKGWYIKFSSDCSRQSSTSSSCSSADLLEFIDSVLSTLNYEVLSRVETFMDIEDELTFFKNFIRMCTAPQGEDGHLGQNLLIHIKAVAIRAAHHCYMYQFFSKITELQHVDPHIYQIYIQAFNGLKLSSTRQPPPVTLEILHDSITSLLPHLFDILKSDRIPAFSNKDQLHILYKGLRFLRTILNEQPKNFDQKTQDLTMVNVVCDAGVVIFSLLRDAATEDGFVQEMDQVLSDLLKRIHLIRADVSGISPPQGLGGSSPSKFNFPKVDELGFFDFLLENLKELTSCEEEATGSAAIPKHQVQTIYEGLVFLRSFLGKIVRLRDEMEEFRVLWYHVVELAYKVEFFIDSSMIGDVPDDSSSQMSFDSITQEINILRLDAIKISIKEELDVTKTSTDFLPLERSVPIIKDKIILLDDEATSIVNRLKIRATELQVVPIVGMPGLGKTTLAKLVYNDSSVMHHFHIRAWCCISHAYKKKNLLLEILACFLKKLPKEFFKKSEDDLALELYQKLKRKKYLIVLDDVWNNEAWDSLKESFPDDANGSRIILTSRFRNVAPKERLNREPHFLRHLSDDESWKLLESKLFPRGGWPSSLHELGTEIVEMCKGLPLTIVILAGILSCSEQGDWRDIVQHCLSSSSAPVLEQCNNILEVSYKYLPDKLKSCLLYFGSFPEDKEHSVDELTWLWIAEGFVEQSKSLEDEAKSYLMYLISRSLVMAHKQSSTGEIKTCRIHDLLHAFCRNKAKKENFFQILNGYEELSNFNETQNVRRLGIYSHEVDDLVKTRLFFLQQRSLFFFRSDYIDRLDGSYLLSKIGISKLVRVLDLREIGLGYTFPGEITFMVQLRYLAVRGDFKSIPSSIANLSNLETLIVNSSCVIELALWLWKLKKLRHLWSSDTAFFILSGEYLGNWVALFNLETCSTLKLVWGDREMISKKFPNIRKLKVDLKADQSAENNKVLVLDSLGKLVSLRVTGGGTQAFAKRQIDICFPLNLRKLTLGRLWLPWCKISAIGELPNLEVLKLFSYAINGENWNMEEAGKFSKLRFFKLSDSNIVKWTASDHFPCLEKLVLHQCYWLEEVPSCFEDISSLQMIEATRCSKSAASSIMRIYEEQVDMGNQDFKVLIDQCDRDRE